MSTLTSKTKLIDSICQVDRFWKLGIPNGGEEEEAEKDGFEELLRNFMFYKQAELDSWKLLFFNTYECNIERIISKNIVHWDVDIFTY